MLWRIWQYLDPLVRLDKAFWGFDVRRVDIVPKLALPVLPL